MPSADDPIDWRPRRVAIAGRPGAGKTTLARRVAATLSAPHVELDSLFHGRGWQPRETFTADVAAFIQAPAWVTEWQYPAARDLIAARADTIIWLDLPSRITLARLARRTITRRVRRERLWNGNVEPPLWTVFTDSDHILRWALRSRSDLTALVPKLERDYPRVHVVRLRSQRQVHAWLRDLTERRPVIHGAESDESR